jgi:ribosomal protein S18 acetylase RimI-like enzyme
MAYFIRPARPDDCPDLARLAGLLNGAEGNPTDLFTEDFARAACFGPRPTLGALVAQSDGGHIVGMALFHDSVNTGFGQLGVYLNDLYVEADYRRHGIGRALIARLALVTKEAGRSFIWWTVKPKNTGGMAFYRALGAGHEAVLAHAVGFDNFDALAREGAANRAAIR